MRRAVLALCCALLLANAAAGQQTVEQLRVGQWVRAKGTLAGGRFQATDVEAREPAKREALTGTAQAVTKDGFRLLAFDVTLAPDVEWRGIAAAELEGRIVEVEGRWRGGRSIVARRIAERGGGRERIEGRIDAIDSSSFELVLLVAGVPIHVERGEAVELDEATSLLDLGLAPERSVAVATLRQEEEDRVLRSFRITDTLFLGGTVELSGLVRDNYDLRNARGDRRSTVDPSARLELLWAPSEDFFGLLNVRHLQTFEDDERVVSTHAEDTSLAELYGVFRNVLGRGVDVQIGRADFDDPREWLYDQNLDAVRVVVDRPSLRVELSASTRLSDASARDEDTTNLIAYVSNADVDRHLAAYVIDRENTTLAGERATHLGARAIGEWLPDTWIWAEGATLRGQTGGQDIEAYGFDIGAVWSPGVLDPFHVSFGYAFGTGDPDPNDGTNETYRQSGLQDNNDKLGGVTSLRYYGELLDPELANLGIASLGIGARLGRSASIDLVAHSYAQDQAIDPVFLGGLRRAPTGFSNDIGTEFDLVLGWRPRNDLQVELILATFDPGEAFADDANAWLAAFQVRYRF